MSRKYIILLLLVAGALLAASKVDKVIQNIQKKFKSVKTLRVDFKQVNEFKLTGIKNEIFGTLYMAQDNKFRLETEDQVLVSDGKTFWRYNKLDNQVLIDFAKTDQQGIFLRDFLFKIGDLYYSQIVEEKKEGRQKTIVLKLTPKNPDDSFFQYVKVWLTEKDWEIKRVVYVDYNENESVYEIEKMVLNPKLPPDLFQFQPPEGVDVVDLRS